MLRDRRLSSTDAGMSLAEVLIAMLILAVLVWGSVAFTTAGRIRMETANQTRAACRLAEEVLDSARAGGYAACVTGSGPDIIQDGTTYSWQRTVTQEPTDSVLDPGGSYKLVTATVTWSGAGSQSVKLRTALAP